MASPSPRDLAIDALATYRLTRLVVDDTITQPLRDRLEEAAYAHVDSLNVEQKLVTLINCPWCAGMWVAFGVVAARRVAPRAWAPLARALAFSAVAGVIARPDHDG